MTSEAQSHMVGDLHKVFHLMSFVVIICSIVAAEALRKWGGGCTRRQRDLGRGFALPA